MTAEIIIAPFSNSEIRDWPIGHFSALIGCLLPRWNGRILVVGAASQKLSACEIVRAYPSTRVLNACGRLDWNEVLDRLKVAACIIGNNSGIAHLGGYFGRPTVCVFGGSHQRLEWRPLGRTVVLVSRVIGCSPCHLDHRHTSPYGKACLREIEPEVVAEAAFRIMDRVAETEIQGAGRALSTDRAPSTESANEVPQLRRSATG